MTRINSKQPGASARKKSDAAKRDPLEDLFDYLHLKTGCKPIPHYAFLEITKKCNFGCVHCQVGYAASGREQSFAEIRSTIDQLAAKGVFALNITGGEPLTRPDFFKIVEHAKRRGFLVFVSTNAYLLTEAAIRRLAKLFLPYVVISIYGMDERTTKRVTGASGVCRRVLHNVRLLTDTGLRVILRMPLLRHSIGQVKRVETFAKEVGANFVPLPTIHARFNLCQGPLDHLPSRKDFEKFLRLYPRYLEPSFHIDGPDQGVCTAGSNYVAIDAQGCVSPCLVLRGGANIRKQSLASILKNNAFFKRCRKIAWRDMPKCMKCGALAHCRPCPGNFQLETGKLTQPAVRSMCQLAWLKKRLYEKDRGARC